jgi:hypothetical protein
VQRQVILCGGQPNVDVCGEQPNVGDRYGRWVEFPLVAVVSPL